MRPAAPAELLALARCGNASRFDGSRPRRRRETGPPRQDDLRARRAAQADATETVETQCNAVHNIYVGTRFDFDCGIVEVRLDGDLPCSSIATNPQPRPARSGARCSATFPPGQHSVEIRLTGTKSAASQGFYYYVGSTLSNVPSRPTFPTRLSWGPTSPSRAITAPTTPTGSLRSLVWAIRKLGLIGEINRYLSVFWWNQRKRSGVFFPLA